MGKGRSSAPDPVATAQAQTAANVAAARESARLNQINQLTPWGGTYWTGAFGSPSRTQHTVYNPTLSRIIFGDAYAPGYGGFDDMGGAAPLAAALSGVPGMGRGRQRRQAPGTDPRFGDQGFDPGQTLPGAGTWEGIAGLGMRQLAGLSALPNLSDALFGTDFTDTGMYSDVATGARDLSGTYGYGGLDRAGDFDFGGGYDGGGYDGPDVGADGPDVGDYGADFDAWYMGGPTGGGGNNIIEPTKIAGYVHEGEYVIPHDEPEIQGLASVLMSAGAAKRREPMPMTTVQGPGDLARAIGGRM